MRWMFRVLALAAALVLHAAALAAAPPPSLHFQVFGDDEGLSHNVITSFLEDRDGYIWIGTEDGLNRFDAHQFRQFTASRDANGLNQSFVRALRQDRHGDIWIATIHGLDRFDPRTERFRHYYRRPGEANSLVGDHVNAILETRDGELWIATHKGLSRYRRATDDFETIGYAPERDAKLASLRIWALLEDPNGQIWVGTDVGLSRYDARLRRFTQFTGVAVPDTPANRQVKALAMTADGQLWVGTGYGLNRFDPSTSHYAPVERAPALAEQPVNALAVQQDGSLWVATNQGLVHWSARNGQLQHVRSDPSDPASLSNDRVRALLVDQHGLLWAGTNDRMNLHNPATSVFSHFRHHPKDANSLSSNRVFGFHEDRDGALWVATAGGLDRLDPAGAPTRHFHTDANARIYAIGEDKHGQLWFSEARGLFTLNPATGKSIQRYPAGRTDTRFLAYSFLGDSQQRLWIGSGYGLYLHQGDEQYEAFFSTAGATDTLCDNEIYAMHQARNGIIWIGTLRGLTRLMPDTRQFHCYEPAREQDNALRQGWVMSIHEDPDGSLWLGTGEGLVHFNPKDGRFQHMGKQYGLPDSYVFGVEADQAGNLWISSNQGLYAFNKARHNSRFFGRNHGTQGRIFNFTSHARLRDGSMVFGSDNGFNRFQPARALAQVMPPAKLTLTGMRVSRAGIPTPQTSPIDMTAPLTLDWKDDGLAIEFSALNYANAAARRYRYRLEGWDDNWVETTSGNRLASFSHLPPGSYRLRVQTGIEPGRWDAHDVKLDLAITPPWWRTPWAYAAMIALLLALAGGRVRAARQRIAALEAAEQRGRRQIEQHATRIADQNSQLQRQTQELETALAARENLFARVSHEFRTPLTLILSPLRGLIDTAAAPEQRTALAIMQRNAESLLRLVDQLLTLARHRRLAASSKEVLAVSGKVSALVQAFELHARTAGIALNLTSNPPCHVLLAPGAMQTVLTNLISNALKYTGAGGSVTVAVHLAEGMVTVSVADTGPGITDEWKERVFDAFERGDDTMRAHAPGHGLGLHTVKELVQAEGGAILLESEAGRGCRFSVSFPACDGAAAPETPAPAPKSIDTEPVSWPAAGAPAAPPQADAAAHTLLVIEDHDDLRALLVDKFHAQYHCLATGCGKEGLELARQHLPDLIICDIDLPGMNGIELCAQLKQDATTAHIPLFFLTAYAGREQLLQGLQAQCDDYLRKPFDVDELRMRVANRLAARATVRSWLQGQGMGGQWQQALAKIETKEQQLVSGARDFRCQLDAVLAKHFNDPDFSVGHLASALAKSVRTLQRTFDIYGLGISPNEYIRNYRLDVAINLLRHNVMVKDVAEACGMEAKNFGARFKARHGLLPQEFRNSGNAAVTAEAPARADSEP